MAFMPMYAREGGSPFGFCPGKATWYPETKNLFRLLVLAAETGLPLYGGGLADQPDWVTEILEWFVPSYKDMQWDARMRRIFGAGDKVKRSSTAEPTLTPAKQKAPRLKGAANGNNRRRT